MEKTVDSLTDTIGDQVKVADLAFKISAAIKKLHDVDIYHFDLKPANIMMMNPYTPVIGDMGLT